MRGLARVARSQIAYDLFALLMPFDFYWPTGKWTVFGVDNIYVSPLFYLSDLALIALLFTSFLQPRQIRSPQWRGYQWIAPFLALSCLAVLTAPFALDFSLAAYTALRWGLAAAISLHFMLARFNVPRFVKVFLVGLLVHVAVGVGQVLLQRPVGLPGEMALPISQPGAAIVAIAGQNWLRAYGLTFHPNVLGGFLVIALLLGMPLLWRSGSRGRRASWLMVWWLLWGGLILTFSRSAMLAALLTVPLAAGWIFWRQPVRRQTLGIAIAGVILIGVAGAALFSEQLVTRLQMGHVTEWLSVGERQAQLHVALGTISSRPLSGVGAGNFPLVMPSFGLDLRALPVHNVPLLLASEVGVVGGAIWIWTLFVAVAHLIKWMQTKSMLCQNVWVVVGLWAWLALWCIALFDYYPWGLNSGRLLSATVLGLTGHVILDEEQIRG